VAKTDPFLKKLKKVRKSRPPAVPKIFMPDFRHAHTLQQSLNQTFGCSVSEAFGLVWHNDLSFLGLLCCRNLSHVLSSLSRPEGVLEKKVLIVVVCGHDESPA